MSGVASKNPYDLLGNDPDEEGVPQAPVQAIEKPAQRAGKRNTNGEPPLKDPVPATRGGGGGERGRGRGGRGGRGDGITGSELAFRDRHAGSRGNRARPTEDGSRGDKREGRIGRGDPRDRRGARQARDDRHSKTGLGPNDHAKQAAHGWGEQTGEGELEDEKAGEAIAAQDEKAADNDWDIIPPNPEADDQREEGLAAAPDAEPEPEDNTKSYADYLAEQQAKKAALGGSLQARKPNETAKFSEGTEYTRDDTEFISGSGGKARRERERKEKNVFRIEHDIQARERESARGGRGGRGRGRGDGPPRGEGRPRGDLRGRGGRGRGEGRPEPRGDFRGGRGARGGASPNVADTNAFPSLGS